MTVDHLILKNLIHNEEYMRNALPYLKEEYFGDKNDKTIYNYINNYILQYNERPSIEALDVMVSESLSIQPEDSVFIKNSLNTFTLADTDEKNMNWLIAETERFCKEKAIQNAILESIHILDGKTKNKDRGMIPELLKDALAVSFDPSVGHDFFENYMDRYDFYHRKDERLEFDIDGMNTASGGGLPNKTLTVFTAGPNVGKSLIMCHLATHFMKSGKNVLYITLEMSEERIAERIDANLLDISLDNLRLLSKAQYDKLFTKQKLDIRGRLVVKEYPTATANVNHFRKLLTELALKKQFVPDVIFIDYLNICASSRIKNNGATNTYVLIKSIAEEIRGLAVEQNVRMITATQLNKEGVKSSDVDMTNISESMGTAHVADWIVAIINTEETERMGQFLLKQLRNRFADGTINKRFYVGVDRSKMRIHNLSTNAPVPTQRVDTDDDLNEFSFGPSEEEFDEIKSRFDSFKY